MNKKNDSKRSKHSKRLNEYHEKLNKINSIAHGKFYENGITTQEQFDTFLSNVPQNCSGYTEIIQDAKNMWHFLNQCKNCSKEELLEKRRSIEKEIAIFPIYREFMNIGVFVDFDKMKNKTVDELNSLLEIADRNTDKNFNRKNYTKTNPLRDIVIDSESKDTYLKQNEDRRIERIDKYEQSLDDKISIINSVLNLKEQEINNINPENENISEDENEIKTAAQKLIQVFLLLKEYNINLSEIKIGISRLADLVNGKENSEEIMSKLKNISEDIDEEWKVGEKLNDQKRNLDIFKAELEKSGIILTEEEKDKIFDKVIRISTQEFVNVLQILKAHNVDLSNIKIGVENQSVLSDILEQKNDADEILAELKALNEDISIDWKIGGTLLRQKKNIESFLAEIKKSGLELTQEEKKKLIEKQGGLNAEEFVQVLVILKQNRIDISDIKARSELSDILGRNNNKDKVIKELQSIAPDIDINWKIGVKLNDLKHTDKIDRFKSAMINCIDKGVIFTEEEIHRLLDKSRGKDTSNSDEIIDFMKRIVSERKNNLTDNASVGKIFDSVIKTIESKKNDLNK